ncbi:WD40 repeat-like protein [Trametes elegans]|nr:WD40 repeat-like protein [Trametes elegans]
MAASAAPGTKCTIKVPSAVSALFLGREDTLCVGSVTVPDDGSVRWYTLPSGKVTRAVKPLGEEISSIVFSKAKKGEQNNVWVASGRKVFCFPSESQKIILSAEDASHSIDLGEDEEDLLNELCVSDNGKSLAFGTDSGTVGVIDLSSKTVARMKSRHTTVCGCVKFIPDRPSELLSGGYDSALLHFDIGQGSVLSRRDIPASPPEQGVSLSPPFVLSMSISNTGLLAASTADGRVWLGGGGEKRSNASQGGRKKRSRKWEGLKEEDGVWLKVAEGPVVSAAFRDSTRLVTCSLLGSLTGYAVSRDEKGALLATKIWGATTSALEKVNAMAVSPALLVVGGFGKDGKGVVEVWHETPRDASEPAP